MARHSIFRLGHGENKIKLCNESADVIRRFGGGEMGGGLIYARSIERDEKNVLISPFCSAPKSRVVAFFFCPSHHKSL